MANHISAEKRARQSIKKRDRNNGTISAFRTVEKKLRKAISTKSLEEATKGLTEFVSKMQKAAQKGVVHKKNAARKVSRLSRQVSALKK